MLAEKILAALDNAERTGRIRPAGGVPAAGRLWPELTAGTGLE
ncbi:MAG TPA: hypothetical protein VHS99_27005 [Chloroflexota bacterium]|nr:hypothetical protein [Chloroflexota bacterium]